MHRKALVALSLLLSASLARAQEAGPGESEVLRDGPFILYSDAKISKEKAQEILKVMRDAYGFVKSELHWKDEAVLDHDLGLHALKSETFKARFKEGTAGFAQGPHAIVMNEAYFDRDRSKLTLAHELTHVQDYRHLAPTRSGKKVPSYLEEGRAILMGRAYYQKLGQDPKADDDGLARGLSQVTVEDAKKTFGEDAFVPENKMDKKAKRLTHTLGFLFVEFLRARPGGKGVPDVQPRLAHVIEKVGAGATLEDAWKDELGESLDASRTAFFEHLEKTAGKPAERFKGTVLEKADPKNDKATPPDDSPRKEEPKKESKTTGE